ncbi:MAG: hypothetical protein U0694_02630 [Anaerolineae bacterium]
MDAEGFWVEPGPGYLPKYHASVWSLLSLAQLGASSKLDRRIATACGYLLEHALARGGQFTASGAPSGTADCLQGTCAALLDLEYDDPRLDSVRVDGAQRDRRRAGVVRRVPCPHALLCGQSVGPPFACGSNDKLPCAWGVVKVMLAFSKLPAAQHTPLINCAIQQGIDFRSSDLADADYPAGYSDILQRQLVEVRFLVFYVTDLLQNVEALLRLGCMTTRARHARWR